MTEDTSASQTDETVDDDETSAEKALEASDPAALLEKSRNAAEGKSDNSSGSVAPSTAQEHIPSTSDPEATDLPTAR